MILAQYNGHPIWWDTQSGEWKYESTGKPISDVGEKCARCGEAPVQQKIDTPSGTEVIYVDYCIRRLVWALNRGGLQTTSSCCGHTGDGFIMLANGAKLIIKDWPKLTSEQEEYLING